MKMLVSVRDVAEARRALGFADFLDLKEPAAGALGGLPPQQIAQIVQALRGGGIDPASALLFASPQSAAPAPGVTADALRETSDSWISATVGDWSMDDPAPVLDAADAVARAGVDLVKVGLRGQGRSDEIIDALAQRPYAVVPVLLVDDADEDALPQLDAHLLERVLARRRSGPRCFPAVMLDTQAKNAGSIVQRVDPAALAWFCQAVRAAGALAGLSGALRADDLPAVKAAGADFAGFRSAVCVQARDGALDPERLARLRAAWPGGAGTGQAVQATIAA